MACAEAALELRADGWTEWAERAIAPLAEAEPGGVAYVRGEVGAGRWCLEIVKADGAQVGYVVWRLESEPDGPRFVILYAAGGAGRRDLTAEALPLFEGKARAMGCRRLSFWTERPGLIVKAARLGYGHKMVLERAL